MKKLVITLLLTLSVTTLAACGKKEGETNDSTALPEINNEQSEIPADLNSVDLLQSIWDQIPSENQFPCFGGSPENSVDSAAGLVALDDENTLINTLLIPDNVSKDATEIASLVHMMNTNTFTSAVIKLNSLNPVNAADQIKDTFLNTQFLCGVPEKITIATYGNFVIYAYGEADIVDEFMGNITIFEGAEIKVNQNF